MINQKMILSIAAILLVAWIAISAIDAGTGWDSPIPTASDTGKRFTCPAPEKAALNFDVTIGAWGSEPTSLSFSGSEWVNEGTTGGPFSWLPYTDDYELEVEVTYDDKTKTYTEGIAEGVYTGAGGTATSYNVKIVTDINNWQDDCADDWSFVQGYSIDYKANLIKVGSGSIKTTSGSITTV